MARPTYQGVRPTTPFAKMRVQYIDGIRAKGFALNSVIGTDEAQLSLSGLGKNLLGIAIFAADGITDQITISFKVNNDVVLEKINASFLQTSENNPRQYFDLYRPLSGQDTILLEFTSGAALAFEVILYYTQGNS